MTPEPHADRYMSKEYLILDLGIRGIQDLTSFSFSSELSFHQNPAIGIKNDAFRLRGRFDRKDI